MYTIKHLKNNDTYESGATTLKGAKREATLAQNTQGGTVTVMQGDEVLATKLYWEEKGKHGWMPWI